MPERLQRSRAFGFVVIALLAVITVMSAGLLLQSLNLSRTLDAQKISAARGECRAAIVNNAADEFYKRIGRALDASATGNRELASQIVHQIATEESMQDRINRQCPAPLVSTTTKLEENQP